MRRAQLRLFACVGLVLAGCVDLSLPDVPLPGGVQGLLDTTPIDGAGHTVALIDTNGTKLSVTSEADGVFHFPEVNPGLYALDVRVEGFAPLVVPNVRVKSGQTADLGVLQLIYLQTDGRANGLIRGKVVSALGPAVQGATVEFYLSSSTQALTSAVTDADGFFSAQVAPGTWRLVAHHPCAGVASASARLHGRRSAARKRRSSIEASV